MAVKSEQRGELVTEEQILPHSIYMRFLKQSNAEKQRAELWFPGLRRSLKEEAAIQWILSGRGKISPLLSSYGYTNNKIDIKPD